MYKVLENKTYRTFDELDDLERQRFISEASEHTNEFDIPELVDEVFRRHLEEKGLNPDSLEMRWSLNHCQGDGCSVLGVITMTPELLARLNDPVCQEAAQILEREDLVLAYEVFARNAHYVHSATMHIRAHKDETELPMEKTDYIGELLLQYLRDMCGDVEVEAYKQIEGLFDEEYYADVCSIGGVLFDEDGRAHWGLEGELVEGERFEKIEKE